VCVWVCVCLSAGVFVGGGEALEGGVVVFLGTGPGGGGADVCVSLISLSLQCAAVYCSAKGLFDGVHLRVSLQCVEVCCMWWLRLVGSLKLHVSFAECSLFYRALLQKRLIILRSPLIVGAP